MALFKQFRGNRASLDAQPLTDGYAYFCVDDGTFHIDYADENGVLHRKQISAKDAETLMGVSLDELKNEIATQDAVILHEAQTYADNVIAQAKESGDLKGEKGDDGISATHSWNGTTLTITSASGTSSANLKGEKGDKGDNGAPGEKGADGAKGADGYTPVRGTDYWTDADKAEIKAYVDEAILNGAW